MTRFVPITENEDDARPSKTALKKQAHEQQALGEALAALPQTRLATIDMPAALRDALHEYQRTRSHEGRRRQRQHIGKLMRQADVAPLQEAVAQAQLGRAEDALALHRAEHWRVELVADDEALTRWLAEHPGTDAQQLRSLIRNARKDTALPPEQRHGRAWRELFQFLKPVLVPADE
ncbi:MAG: ribosome biogenesis factor YjgA [Burkholderiaceae bacterium]|nr:ribosome biogenesis factor YjgA [Burkholderiaceae bacterium]